MALDPELLDILACPESKAPLVYFEAEGFLFCPKSRLKYPIQDGIPVMLIDEAERLDDSATAKLMADAKARGLKNA
ncbi:MAG: Trm112 family protein [Planctomycetes bacterium]|nr:Trm112 family protein [Planctomycetota bacterium]MCC7171189.1 Trm112 family protein [Planctomycetota bacterium]